MRAALLLATLLVILTVSSALAVDNGANPLTGDELLRWAEGYLDLARAQKPLNDPADAEALTEAGYAFVYPFATLYMSRPDIASELRGLEIVAGGEPGPHATAVAMSSAEVLARFYTENETLSGAYDQAVLYLREGERPEDGVSFGMVQRDGQRLSAIQYSVMTCLDAHSGAYADMGVIFTLREDMVSAITAYGLNSQVSLTDMLETARMVGRARLETGYSAVPLSYSGLDLSPFEAADLRFSGIDFPGMRPEEAMAAFGQYEDVWAEAEDGYDRTLRFGGLELTWRYDKKMANPGLSALTLTDASLEGPRAVRVGDSLTSVMCRFRYGEGSYDGTTETLYGYAGEAPWGIAEYAEDGSAALRYVCALPDGREAVMLLSFDGGVLGMLQLWVSGMEP